MDPKYVDDLAESIRKNYNIDIISLLDSFQFNKLCSITSNHTFRKNTFNNYMNWMEPMIGDLKDSIFCGHQVERSISFFYFCHNIKNIILKDILHHYRLNSHKTQNLKPHYL